MSAILVTRIPKVRRIRDSEIIGSRGTVPFCIGSELPQLATLNWCLRGASVVFIFLINGGKNGHDEPQFWCD